MSNTGSTFVGTTTNTEPDLLYEGAQYRYDIVAPGGIDVNATFGDDSRWASENEIAFPGGIDSGYIRGVWKLQPDGTWGEYQANEEWYIEPNERD